MKPRYRLERAARSAPPLALQPAETAPKDGKSAPFGHILGIAVRTGCTGRAARYYPAAR